MTSSAGDSQEWEDRSVSLVMANVLSLAAMFPLIALAVAPFGLIHGWAAVGRSLSWLGYQLLLAAAVFAVSVVAHEGLHAVGWLIFAGVPRSEIEFGIRQLTPYAHTSATVEAGPYRIGIALPALLLGALPAIVSWLTGSGVLMVYGALMLVAAAGDILVLWLLRDVPASRLVQDHPTRAGCRVLQPG